MKKAINEVVNIKPVFSNMVHSDSWEGPCRVGTLEELDPKYEVRAGLEKMKVWEKELREKVSSKAKILDPVCIQYDESFVVPDSELAKLEGDLQETDIFLITYRVPGIEKLGKPIVMIDRGPTSVDLVGFFRSEGLEAYMAHEWDEFNELITCLQVKKAMKATKILIMSASNQFPASVNTSISDRYGLFTKYGVRHTALPMIKVFDEMNRIEKEEEITKLAEKVANGATVNNVKFDWVKQDVRYHEAVKSLMERFDCNAFTTACKELCASRYPMRNKCTPCLNHSLLKDSGIPSACEEDLNVLMAMMVFMYSTRQSVFMGNPMLMLKGMSPIKNSGMSRQVFGPEDGFEEEVLEVRHAVPSTMLNGFDQDPMPYELGSFTHEGFGSKMHVNMAEGRTKKVTLGRFDRTGTKMIVASGEIVACAFRDDECSPAVYYRIKGGARAYRFALAEGNYGHHQAVVYGDQTELIKKVGKVVGFNVEVFGE